ncbi:hypothetical protein CYY_009631, partial [Polysphondylium violaceum]
MSATSPRSNENNNNSNNSNNDKVTLTQVFNSLKPLCDRLMTLLSNTNAQTYKDDTLKQLGAQVIDLLDRMKEQIVKDDRQIQGPPARSSVIGYIFEYIMIPLSLIFNSKLLSENNARIVSVITKESVLISSFQLLDQLLQRITSIKSISKFVELLQLVTSCLFKDGSNSNSSSKNDTSSDEFIISGLECLKSLFICSEIQFFDKQVYSIHPFLGDNQQFVGFGYTISCLLSLLNRVPKIREESSSNSDSNNSDLKREEKISRPIKTSVLSCLDTCLQPFISRNIEYYPLLYQVSPAIISNLFKVITGDYKLGSKLKIQALNLFTSITVSIMNDKVYEQIKSTSPALLDTHKISSNNIHKLCCIIFPNSQSHSSLRPNQNKYSESSQTTLTCRIQLDKYQNRQAIVQSSYQILSNCCKESLSSLVPLLVEVLVLYLTDQFPQLVEMVQGYLAHLQSNESQLKDIVKDTIKDNFDHLFQSLPRLVCGDNMENGEHVNISLDEDKKALVTKLCIAYIIAMENDLSLLLSCSRIESVATTLLSLVEMTNPSSNNSDQDDAKNNSQILSSSLQDSLKIVNDNLFSQDNNKKKRVLKDNLLKPFIHFSSIQVENNIIELIQMFGRYSKFIEWIDIFLSNGSLSISPKRKEIIFILNQLMLGSSKMDNNGFIEFTCIQYILDEILSPNLLYL